jgi:hypothetical protein
MAIEPVYVCRMMATNGQLEWSDRDQPPITIHSGQTLMAVGGDVPQVSDSGSLPAWVSNTDISEIELRASKELETMIDPSRSLGLNLAERVDHRQVEVAALAIASLCTMEEFEPCIEAFRDERFRSYWKSLYDRIQWALSGDVSAAERLLAAMEKNRPDEARTLYELVCGYDNQQLEAGADKRLVGLLQSRSMDVRVLAFENLRRITGRPLNYRPENEPAQQRRALQDWQNRLERGQIRWPTASAG